MHARTPEEILELEQRLHRWVRKGLISEETAGRIWALERETPTGTPPATAAEPARPVRRVPVLTEVFGYLGAALAAAAVAVFVGRSWDDLSQAQQLALPAVGLVLFLVAGFAIHRSDEPAVQRLAGLLWFLATGSAGWLTAVWAMEVADVSDRQAMLSVGAVVSAVGGALYAYRRWVLPQLALVGGLGLLIGGAFFEDELVIGIALTVLGAAWAALGALRLLAPTAPTVAIGGVVALWSPTVVMADHTGGGLLVGVAIAAGVVGLGALIRQGIVIGLGVAGLFLYLVGAIDHFLEGSAATALGFLVVGVGLMALAVIGMRMRPRQGPPRPAHG